MPGILNFFTLFTFVFLIVNCTSKKTEPLEPVPCSSIQENTNSWSPLTAVATFSTDVETKVTIKVSGKEPNGQTIEKTYENFNTSHTVPVVGLYPDFENKVEIMIADREGKTATQECLWQTGPIPDSAQVPQQIEVTTPLASDSNSLFLVAGNGGDFVVDTQGEIRWHLGYTSDPVASDPKRGLIFNKLKNENFILGFESVGPEGTPGYFFKKLLEMDILGNKIKRYDIPDYVHHSVLEDIFGNLVVATSNPMTTSEDLIIVLDRSTGEQVNTCNSYDFLDILGYDNVASTRARAVHGRADDWAHINAMSYNPITGNYVFSLRQQSAVIEVACEEYDNSFIVQWVLGHSKGWEPSVADKLIPLDPAVNTKLPGGQHSISLIGREGVTYLLVFDNGTNRGVYSTFAPDNPPNPHMQNKNRIIEYKLNDKNTDNLNDDRFEITWEYEPNENYNSFRLGSVKELENGNFLILFPSPGGTEAPPTRIIQITRDKKIIYDIKFPGYNSTWAFQALPFSF